MSGVTSDEDLQHINGGTDGTKVGNVGDALKVNLASAGGAIIFDSMLAIAAGQVAGVSHINKHGSNPSVGNSSYETLWDGGGVYTFAPTAQQVNVASSSADDSSAGTGARTVRLEGLDANHVELSETVTMNGTTDVLSTGSYLRLHRAYVLTAGSGEANAGDISFTQQTSAIIMAQISNTDGFSQTQMLVYTVPAGKTGYMVDVAAHSAKDKPATVRLWVCEPGGVFRMKLQGEGELNFHHPWLPYLPVPEKTDVFIEAKRNTGASRIDGTFNMILVTNP